MPYALCPMPYALCPMQVGTCYARKAIHLSASAIDYFGVGKRHRGVSRVAYLFIRVSVSESLSCLPSSLLFNFCD
jgi:hypothetical protein